MYPIKIDKQTERPFITNTKWRELLGSIVFDLPEKLEGTIFEKSFTPTFRSMISYFVRRDNSGGMKYLERQAQAQQRWDWQENLSYLLGLDWRISQEFQDVSAREKMLEQLKKAAKGGALGDVVGTVAELRSQVTVADKRANDTREQLENFKVLDSYKDLSAKAAKLKSEMQKLGRESVSLNETLNHLLSSLDDEAPPNKTELENLYSMVGIELPGVALRRLSDVNTFGDDT